MSPSVLVALLAGAMLSLQAAFNARLERVLGSPIWAKSVSGTVTTIVLAALASRPCARHPPSRVPRRCPGGRGPGDSAASSRSSA